MADGGLTSTGLLRATGRLFREGVAVSLLLCGCATGAGTISCQTTDWRMLGREDGAAGHDASVFEKRLSACGTAATGEIATLYDDGRRDGLALYCTAATGWRAGRAGSDYGGVCPAALEPAFLDGYEKGRTLLALAEAAAGARRDYLRAVEELERQRYNLEITRDRYNRSALLNEDWTVARLEIERHTRAIELLEADLPDYRTKFDAAEAALARIELAAGFQEQSDD